MRELQGVALKRRRLAPKGNLLGVDSCEEKEVIDYVVGCFMGNLVSSHSSKLFT